MSLMFLLADGGICCRGPDRASRPAQRHLRGSAFEHHGLRHGLRGRKPRLSGRGRVPSPEGWVLLEEGPGLWGAVSCVELELDVDARPSR
jgi:hypothetical protein